ncbi:hypothetical protein F5Y15DRAFT_366880 [Xylariaceae sp. FL0016]|nr:hypothetical protein F5Y15DRAFT_366880 [Xylariaceae sp. FL0016]
MFEEEMEDNWQQTFLTNSTSPYFVTAAFLSLLADAEKGPVHRVGCVVNNTSVSGFMRMTQNRQFSYNMSKAAANHLTRQMAVDLGHEKIGVRVNGIALGYFPSEMTTAASNEENESVDPGESFKQYMRSLGISNVKRMGSARDIASVSYFLMIPYRFWGSSYTGSVANADWIPTLKVVLTVVTNEFMWGTITILDGGFTMNAPGNM